MNALTQKVCTCGTHSTQVLVLVCECEEKLIDKNLETKNLEGISLFPRGDGFLWLTCIWYHRGRYHRLQEIGCYTVHMYPPTYMFLLCEFIHVLTLA